MSSTTNLSSCNPDSSSFSGLCLSARLPICSASTEKQDTKGLEKCALKWCEHNVNLAPSTSQFRQQVRFVSVKAERPYHPSCYHARGRVVVVGGGPPRRHVHDSIRLSRLTVALGLKIVGFKSLVRSYLGWCPNPNHRRPLHSLSQAEREQHTRSCR